MNADVSALLAYGGFAVILGCSSLLLVRRNLAPAALLAGGGRIFLTAALGIGILGFTIKMLIILAFLYVPGVAPRHGLAARPTDPTRWEPQPRLPIADTASAGIPPSPIWLALPEVAPVPADNPQTSAKIALGRKLFEDPRLSRDATQSCATCHDLDRRAGADGRPTAIGVDGAVGRRNTPTVYNAAFQTRLFWDGRAGSLETQAVGPLVNPIEMAMPSTDAVVARVKTDPTYAPAFAAAFGTQAAIDIDTIAKAIAAFERTLITPDTPYDRFVAGDASALSESQKRGMARFEQLGCILCHAGPNFSGAGYPRQSRPFARLRAADSASAASYDLLADKGKAPADAREGVWRVPSLRNVALTSPYLHNGSVSRLEDAVRLMAEIQIRARLDLSAIDDLAVIDWSAANRTFARLEPRVATNRDIDDIAEFLRALSSDRLRAGMAQSRP